MIDCYKCGSEMELVLLAEARLFRCWTCGLLTIKYKTETTSEERKVIEANMLRTYLRGNFDSEIRPARHSGH